MRPNLISLFSFLLAATGASVQTTTPPEPHASIHDYVIERGAPAPASSRPDTCADEVTPVSMVADQTTAGALTP